MGNKLVAFLGKGKYDTTEYVWGDRSLICQYSMVASTSFMEADQVVVFATREARESHEQPLRQAMPEWAHLEVIEIPRGEKQEELWEIFSLVAGAVQNRDVLVFDVTHGLRSFPIIGVLAAAFLRSALGLDLRAVLYGAYDVRDQSVTPSRTQMFDLTPLLTLLEWAVAADRFNRTGDSRYFASLLKQKQAHLAKQFQGRREELTQLGDLGRLSGALSEISQSLALIRPHLAMQQIAALRPKMEKALPLLEKEVKPFRLVFDIVLNAYESLALSEPTSEPWKDLECERRMIEWYADREHWVQAISLTREWLLSWVMYHLGLNSFTDLSDRHRIESVVNSEADEFVQAKRDGTEFNSVFLKQIPNLDRVLGLWKNVAEVRNDIDHAGMRQNPKEPNSLVSGVKSIIEQIKELPIQR